MNWIAGLPRLVRFVVPALVLLLAAGGAVAALSGHHRASTPGAPRVAVASASPAGSANPTASVEPSPSPSPDPGPSPSETPQTSPSARPAAAPGALPGAPGCAQLAGGFPGAQLAASFPVALAWSPDGRLFWAERAGSVRVYEDGGTRTFAEVATVTTERGGGYSERGLLGLAISGNYVFAMYSNADYATQTIVRWTDCGGSATNPVVIAAGLPAGADCCHKGGRLAVSPDGHLFATIGDNHAAAAAQDPADLRGKVLRFNLDGSGRSVWTAGLRNPFGLAFAPDGTLALTNNGPSQDAGTPCGACGDEVYVVGRSAGLDYQWPYCWGYSHPFNGPLGNHPDCNGLPGPQYSTEQTGMFVAPTGMTWSAARGAFVFCASSNSRMYQYTGQGTVTDTGLSGCGLDVKQGPDGALYSSTTGAIFRH